MQQAMLGNFEAIAEAQGFASQNFLLRVKVGDDPETTSKVIVELLLPTTESPN